MCLVGTTLIAFVLPAGLRCQRTFYRPRSDPKMVYDVSFCADVDKESIAPASAPGAELCCHFFSLAALLTWSSFRWSGCSPVEAIPPRREPSWHRGTSF